MALEKAEAERMALEKAEAERMALEKAEAEWERAQAERLASEKAEAERAAAETAAMASAALLAAKMAAAERAAAEKAKAERVYRYVLEKEAAAERVAVAAEASSQLPLLSEVPSVPITHGPVEPITAPSEPELPVPAELPNSTERAACLEAAPPAALLDESTGTSNLASLLPRLPPLPRRPPPPSPPRRTSMPPTAAETQSLPEPITAPPMPITAPPMPITAPSERTTADTQSLPVAAASALEPSAAAAEEPPATAPATAPATLEPATVPATLEPATAPAILEPATAPATLEFTCDAEERAAAVKVQAARRAQLDRARVAELREQRAKARREELAIELRESEARRAAAVKVQAARRAQLDRARVGQLREQRAEARREVLASRAASDVEASDPFASDVEASDVEVKNVEAKNAVSPGRQHTKALELLRARLGGGFDKGDVGASVPTRRRPSCCSSAVMSTLASGVGATDGGAHHGAPKVSKWATVKAIDDSAQRQRLAKPSKSPRPSAGSAAPSPLPESEAESSASYRSIGEETPDLVLATQPTEMRAAAYDEDMENDAREWIEAATGAPVGDKECGFRDLLMSGEVLCQLVNVIVPGSCPPPAVPKNALVAPSMHRENIGHYLQACTAIGLQPSDSFQTVDLYEGRDMMAVLRQIHALGRLAQRLGYDGPTLGARESTAAPRTFSEVQLRESREQEKLLYKQARPVIAL